MPFLRVVRDRRGYETTYLLHWYREGSRQRSRILYVFRSPHGVRVGRSALEPDTLRQIEGRYPDIAFDWNVVRENQQIIEPQMEARRRRPRREEESVDQSFGVAPGGSADVSHESTQRPQVQSAAPSSQTDRPAEQPRHAVPAVIQGLTPDEQIAFLTHWYPIICERIPRRTSDPARIEALLALAERLNPSGWTDADQITTGLQQAADALERLSRVFSRRRRRPKRRAADARQSDPAAPAKPSPE